MSLSELDQARKQLAVMREQRDALAYALKQIADYSPGSIIQPMLIARAALAKAGVE